MEELLEQTRDGLVDKQVFHMVDNGLEKQRLVFLDGESLEIVNDGHSLNCIHPGEKAIHGEAIYVVYHPSLMETITWRLTLNPEKKQFSSNSNNVDQP